VSTLPNPAPAGCQAGVFWRRCARCDALFPPAPGQLLCPGCHPACSVASRPDDRAQLRGWFHIDPAVPRPVPRRRAGWGER
jgi:hypothetical protein